MNKYELIEAAADLLQHTGWTQKAMARDINGSKTSVFPDLDEGETQPVCYCALGALIYVEEYADSQLVRNLALHALHKAAPGGSLIVYNDAEGRTKEQVLMLMRKTAAKLRAVETGEDSPYLYRQE